MCETMQLRERNIKMAVVPMLMLCLSASGPWAALILSYNARKPYGFATDPGFVVPPECQKI